VVPVRWASLASGVLSGVVGPASGVGCGRIVPSKAPGSPMAVGVKRLKQMFAVEESSR
jgi:hypothetical protein